MICHLAQTLKDACEKAEKHMLKCRIAQVKAFSGIEDKFAANFNLSLSERAQSFPF